MNLEEILKHQREFVSKRDWDQFHHPKNLSMALAVEVAELLEIFQWISPEDGKTLINNSQKQEQISNELADIFFYLLRLSDKLNIDLEQAFWDKMKKNALKYPVEKAKGNAKKYTEL